ncbi:MAG: hypothetical protein ACYTAF_12485 [Planctomycetota bacterium]|jgi:Sec-independent protein translocase protein TatA
MSAVIGAILGLIVFVAVILLGAVHRVDFLSSLIRAIIGLGVGLVLGLLLFGPLGISLAKRSAGETARKPSKREKTEEGEEEEEEEEQQAPAEEAPPEPEPGG